MTRGRLVDVEQGQTGEARGIPEERRALQIMDLLYGGVSQKRDRWRGLKLGTSLFFNTRGDRCIRREFQIWNQQSA